MSLLFLPLLPSVALAEAAPLPDAGASFLQMLVGLAVVLAMLVGSLWLLKRLTHPRGQNSSLMRIVAGTAVGQRERVVLLEIGSTWLVLGVAPGEVSMLAEVPRQDIPAAAGGNGGKDFAGWLKHITERRHGPQA
ncbi:MAG: flagellar biosynthetic protein FliO [Rhodocyclaceae bacterium]|nr:flagellar biosynthetic protein FliO [Rhodocyclaceae bacterium]